MRDYQLHKLPVAEGQTGFPIELIPGAVSEETLKSFKSEFGKWIIGCGLRELLEHYALALDYAHTVGLFLLHRKGKADALGSNLAKMQRDFHALGIPRKLELLQSRLGIAPHYPDYIDSLYKARNCLAHGGVANARNVNANGELRLRWQSLEVWAENKETGLKLVGQDMIGKVLPDGADVMLGHTEREKVFKVGEPISLSQQDLWEICHFFASDCIPSLMRSVMACFEQLGLPVEYRNDPKMNVKVTGRPRKPQ